MVVLLGLLLVTACGGDDESEAPLTKGSYCDATGSAYCRRAEVCGLAPFDSCLSVFKGACCVDDQSCDFKPKDEAAVRSLQSKCVPALSSQDCSEQATGQIPAACTTL